MTIAQLENRADRLFGREADLTRLLQRTQHFGLTAIVGPPQIGKSWLLMELAAGHHRAAVRPCWIRQGGNPQREIEPFSHEVHYLVTQDEDQQ